MSQRHTLYVCHGNDSPPKIHPCRRAHEALRAAGVEYDTVIDTGVGHPIPFLRKGDREPVRAATGTDKLPSMVLADGTILTHSKAIIAWARSQ